jgi:hypothetical protein
MTAELRQYTRDDATAPSEFDDQAVDTHLEVAQPFDPAKIRITTTQALLTGIIRRIDHQEIDLEPTFQHRARLWDNGRKSRLIESLLLRIPLPLFYVAADSKDNWRVVDGLQRLTTIHDFIKAQFALDGLEYMPQLSGLTFSGLPRAMQRRLEETPLLINIIMDGTPEELIINIFKRINTGGLEWTLQEIRNAVYPGAARQFLRELVALPCFKEGTGNKVNDERLAAQEMVLGFLAFRLTPWQEYCTHNPGRDNFLNHAMRQINEMSDTSREALQADFTRAMWLAVQLFGADAFRRPHAVPGKHRPINRPLFETWSVTLANLPVSQHAPLIAKKAKLHGVFADLMQDERFNTAIRFASTNLNNIRYRFEKIQKLIDEVLQ